jgi:amidase
MLTSDYERYDGYGLAGLLRSGAISPYELMACAVELAHTRGAALNALCYERFEESLAIARRAQLRGAFAGLPFLLKNSALPATRFPADVGSRLLRNTSFRFDATLVKRFEAAGLIPFARTTVPEFCMAPTTEAVANGAPTLNPWDTGRSAGGSSGGAAAAVAAGIVPLAHGNDGGGSIRIPASCCGIYGLKPSRGLVPMGPSRGEGWGGLAVEGVLSRTVRDTAAALDAVGGYEPGAPYASPMSAGSYLDLLSRPFARPLRIASWSSAWGDISVAPECVAAVRCAENLLRSQGHEVVEIGSPSLDYAKFIDALIDVLAANVTVTINAVIKDRPLAECQADLEPAFLDAYYVGQALTAERYVAAITAFHSVGRRIESHMTGFDLALTPTLTRPPAQLGEFSTDTDFRSFRQGVARYTAFLAVLNASGQPAATLPLYWSDADLPIGVQLIGHFGRDDQILQLSNHLETESGWSKRRPPQLRTR